MTITELVIDNNKKTGNLNAWNFGNSLDYFGASIRENPVGVGN
jgi:hypothetical protein